MIKKHWCILIFMLLSVISHGFYQSYCLEKNIGINDRKSVLPKNLRIVSFSPAITEMVYILDLDKYLVGVTKYCAYPADARSKQKIGGYYDPNMEAVMHLRPDYVLLGTEHLSFVEKFRNIGIQSVVLDNSSPEKIMESILKIGKFFARENLALDTNKRIREKIHALNRLTREAKKIRVLLIFGEDMAGEIKSKLFAVGNDSFYTPIIELVGGENILKNTRTCYPLLSHEGIINLNPDVIVELVQKKDMVNDKEVLDKWSTLSMVKAVREKKVYALQADYIMVPGPRFAKIAEDLFNLFHRERDNLL